MSDTLRQVIALVNEGSVRVSEHGYDELAADGIQVRDVISGLPVAELVEDYPDFPKGPCVLLLQRSRDGDPIHVLWGIPRGATGPCVLITAYRPDLSRWDENLKRRKP